MKSREIASSPEVQAYHEAMRQLFSEHMPKCGVEETIAVLSQFIGHMAGSATVLGCGFDSRQTVAENFALGYEDALSWPPGKLQ